jgi:DNA repair exonuclease SbcCD ATPase subunit
MKTTQEIIDELEQMERVQWGHYSSPSHLCTKDARERLRELQQELNASDALKRIDAVIKERDEARAEVERLKQALHDARLENSGQAAQLERTRPAPSRLEIAAMAMQAFIGTSAFIMDIPKHSLEYADALIAASNEGR